MERGAEGEKMTKRLYEKLKKASNENKPDKEIIS